MSDLSAKTLLHKILYMAFVEVREAAVPVETETPLSKIFRISDLLHNLPLILDGAKSEGDYDLILKELRERAEMKGLERWLHNLIAHLQRVG